MATPDCTHFSWNTTGKGLCSLRRGKVSKELAMPNNDTSSVCGLLSINWNSKDFAFGCEFDANILDTMALSVTECSDECISRPECSVFSWRWDGSSGHCHLQQGNASTEEAYFVSGNNAACGLKASNTSSLEIQKPYRNLGELRFNVGLIGPIVVGSNPTRVGLRAPCRSLTS